LGTNEFVHFCKLIGAEPYLAANVRSLPAIEFQHWVEYCNSPAGSTTSADSLIASGPNTDEWFWTREFLQEILRKGPGQLREIYGLALHHYAWNLSRGKTNDWDKGKGAAEQFEPVDWYELLR